MKLGLEEDNWLGPDDGVAVGFTDGVVLG